MTVLRLLTSLWVPILGSDSFGLIRSEFRECIVCHRKSSFLVKLICITVFLQNIHTIKHKSHLKKDKRYIFLEPNMSDQDPGTQIQVSPNSMFQLITVSLSFYSNRTKKSHKSRHFKYINGNIQQQVNTAKREISVISLRYFLMAVSFLVGRNWWSAKFVLCEMFLSVGDGMLSQKQKWARSGYLGAKDGPR